MAREPSLRGHGPVEALQGKHRSEQHQANQHDSVAARPARKNQDDRIRLPALVEMRLAHHDVLGALAHSIRRVVSQRNAC
jgi:hypothetical protein